MRSSSKLAWIRINFRVNDLEFRQGLMRPSEPDANDFQILIEDRFLGSFALHDDFDLQLRGREGGDWKKVSLEELKMAFLETFSNVGAAGTQEVLESSTPLAGLDVSDAGNSLFVPRISIEGDSGHINRATEAFSRGRVKYQIVGGIGSRGQVWGNATFVVDSLHCARILLYRAGFLPSSDSEHVVIDSKNGWKIRLLGYKTDNGNSVLPPVAGPVPPGQRWNRKATSRARPRDFGINRAGVKRGVASEGVTRRRLESGQRELGPPGSPRRTTKEPPCRNLINDMMAGASLYFAPRGTTSPASPQISPRLQAAGLQHHRRRRLQFCGKPVPGTAGRLCGSCQPYMSERHSRLGSQGQRLPPEYTAPRDGAGPGAGPDQNKDFFFK